MVQQADPISVIDQIQYLLAQGMALPNIERAERTLNHVGFHRLSSYGNRLNRLPELGRGYCSRKALLSAKYLPATCLTRDCVHFFWKHSATLKSPSEQIGPTNSPIISSTGSSLIGSQCCSTSSTTMQTSKNYRGPAGKPASCAPTTSKASLYGMCCQQCLSGNSRNGIQP